MKLFWYLCGAALALSVGAQAQVNPKKAEADAARKAREEAREHERSERDAFVAELGRAERERDLAGTIGADHIAFAPGTIDLSKDAETMLVRTVHWLRVHPDTILLLQERCPHPLSQAHFTLGQRRTQRVSDFLVDYAASAKRVQRQAPTQSSGAPADCAVFLSTTATP